MPSERSTPPLRWFRLWLVLGWGLVGLVIVLSLVPTQAEPQVFKAQDKLMHLGAYCVVMAWFGALYRAERSRRRAAVLLVLMGLLLELAQGATNYRSLQGLDMLANGLGVAIGWAVARTKVSRVFVLIESRL